MLIAESIASVLAILAAVAAAVIGLIVWFGNRKNHLRLVFLWLTIFVAGWIISNVLFVTSIPVLRFGIALLSYGVAMAVAVQTLLFILKLVRVPIKFSHVLVISLGYLIAIVSSLPNVIATGIDGAEITTRYETLGAYGIVLTAYLLGACGVLIAKRSHAARPLRRQIRLIFLGIGVASIVGLTFNLLLPISGNYSFVQLGPAGATIFVGVIAYSIARYSLFDVRLAIIRAIAYLATFATLGAIYFGVVYFVAIALNSPLLSSDQVLLNIVAALAMALLLQPIKKFFDRFTSKVFYRDNYDTDEFFARLNKILSSTIELRRLLTRSSQEIADTFKSDQAHFFVYVDEDHHIAAGTAKHSKLPLKDVRSLDGYSERSGEDLILESSLSVDDPLKRMMISYSVQIALPLLTNSGILGYLFLGERRSGSYTRRDIRTLGTTADELVIAIQNTLAVQEVRNLNATLQQRINSATQELRRSNAQLQKLDEAKDEFISMASHQLRTPLTSIKGYISMLVEGDVGKVSPQQKHLLDEAFISSERMVRLIGDFLNVSRLQTGKFVIEKHPVDLSKLVAHEIEALLPNSAARGLKFTYKQPKNFPMLDLDENKIQQVVMNFADNAIYYSKENSTIKIGLSIVKNKVEFTVKDTGIGVPKAQQDQLFNKFFRATNARKQRPDGTGVGLFLAKKVIDAHDGQIIFESKENRGSTFGFRLPILKLRASNADKLEDKPADK